MDALLLKRRLMMDVFQHPPGYTLLEYVVTDSRAYVDTGVNGNNNNLIINADFMTTKFVQYGYVLGNYNTNDNYNVHRIIYGSSNDRVLVNHNTQAANGSMRGYSTNVRHTMRITHSGYTMDGASYALSGSVNGTTNTRNICLGAQYIGTAVVRDIGLHVYSFSIYDGATPLLTLAPCKRNSDNVAGFFDFTSRSFVRSATAYDFVAGPEI